MTLPSTMTVHVERRGAADRILLVTLDRQERRNAVDRATLAELRDALTAPATDGVRVLVLTGAGGHFCAGADLTDVEDESFATALQQVLTALSDAPFATIAAVDGAALGAGTQLAIACDLRVATHGSRFGIPAGKLGLMVNHWTVRRLALLVGAGPARAMLLAAETISGDDANRLGLVNRTGFLDQALAWADEIGKLAPLTITGHKLMLNRLEPALADDPDVTAGFSTAWHSTDLQEGLAAFREKRPPEFTGH